MEIFNIGIVELVFILLLMLVLLGPEGMLKTARGIAVFVRKFLHSPIWSDLMRINQDFQEMPTRLMREAGMDEINQEIASAKRDVRENVRGTFSWDPTQHSQPVNMAEPRIAPPLAASSTKPGNQPDHRPQLAETPRQAYRRATAAIRKTRRSAIYHREIISPKTGQYSANNSQDLP